MYLPLAVALVTLEGNSPGMNWLQLAGLSLIAALSRSMAKMRSLASTGAPSAHL